MRRRHAARAGALLLLVAPRLAAQQDSAAATVLPPQRAVVISERVLLWAPLPDRAGGPSLALRLPRRTVPAATTDDGRFLHHIVQLTPGDNHIELAAADSVVLAWDLRYRPASSLDAGEPEALAPFLLHREVAPGRCARCHPGVWQPGVGVSQPLDSVACFGCHQEFLRGTHRHGPAASWMCLACHRSNGRDRLVEPPARMGPVCLSCHTNVAAGLASAAAVHGPAAGGFCTACHDAHAAEQAALVREPMPALCGQCHSHETDGSHVTGWTGGSRPHPVAGVADPSKPGRELSCASCHDPHASPARHLFREATSSEELCRRCHAGPREPQR